MSSVYRVKVSTCQDENLVTHYLNCLLSANSHQDQPSAVAALGGQLQCPVCETKRQRARDVISGQICRICRLVGAEPTDASVAAWVRSMGPPVTQRETTQPSQPCKNRNRHSM